MPGGAPLSLALRLALSAPRLLRAAEDRPVTVLLNFTESGQWIGAWALRLPEGPLEDALACAPVRLEHDQVRVPPYAALWLRPA